MYVLSLLYLHFLTKKMKELDLIFSEVPYTALSLSFPTHTQAHPLGAHSHLPTPYTHKHTHTHTHTHVVLIHISPHWFTLVFLPRMCSPFPLQPLREGLPYPSPTFQPDSPDSFHSAGSSLKAGPYLLLAAHSEASF